MSGDFELTPDELRVVARYVAESAAEALPVFEAARPDDLRPRLALDAAWEFVGGARRTKLQRVTSMDAHRAAKEAPSEASRLAARAAGDAASAAYLHPLADAAQVGHILRAAASVARIAEIDAAGDPEAAAASCRRQPGDPGAPRRGLMFPVRGAFPRVQDLSPTLVNFPDVPDHGGLHAVGDRADAWGDPAGQTPVSKRRPCERFTRRRPPG